MIATAEKFRTPAVEASKRTFSGECPERNRCHRCGGLTVGEFCTDLLSSTGELEFLASRCVQCGEVVDPVILLNRMIQGSSSTRPRFGSVGINS